MKTLKTAIAALGLAVAAASNQASAEPFSAAVDTCRVYAKQYDMYFDVYLIGWRQVNTIGTVVGRFQFDKCMSLYGISMTNIGPLER